MKIKNSKGKPFDKCFIDADSIIYRIALKTDISLKKAMEYYDRAIEEIQWETCSGRVYVALKGEGNFRYDIEPDYKGQRKVSNVDEAVVERRKDLNEYAYSLGHFKSDNCEADDVVSIWAQQSLDAKEHYVIAHIDKDIDMVEGWHYNFTKETLYYICKDQGYRKMCLQMLTGDSTDNIQGLVGIGPKKAEKLLADVPQPDMLDKVREAWEEAHPEDRRTWDGFKRLTIKDTLEHDKV